MAQALFFPFQGQLTYRGRMDEGNRSPNLQWQGVG